MVVFLFHLKQEKIKLKFNRRRKICEIFLKKTSLWIMWKIRVRYMGGYIRVSRAIFASHARQSARPAAILFIPARYEY
jgi:hypothetical protein